MPMLRPLCTQHGAERFDGRPLTEFLLEQLAGSQALFLMGLRVQKKSFSTPTSRATAPKKAPAECGDRSAGGSYIPPSDIASTFLFLRCLPNS